MFFAEGVAITGAKGVGERPLRFAWRRQEHRVVHVSEHWRVHTNWWTDHEDFRDYWEVATDTGLLVIVYQDLNSHAWFLERLYE